MTPNETLRQFLTEHGVDTDYVTVVEEMGWNEDESGDEVGNEDENGNGNWGGDRDGNPVRYRLDLDRAASREDIVAFYRMQAVNLVNTDGERTWVFADHVGELRDNGE